MAQNVKNLALCIFLAGLSVKKINAIKADLSAQYLSNRQKFMDESGLYFMETVSGTRKLVNTNYDPSNFRGFAPGSFVFMPNRYCFDQYNFENKSRGAIAICVGIGAKTDYCDKENDIWFLVYNKQKIVNFSPFIREHFKKI